MACALGVKLQTAYGWIKSGRTCKLPRGGPRETSQKVKEFHVIALLNWLGENPQLTLKQLCEKLYENYNVRISHQTVGKHLDGRLISLKSVHFQPETANSDMNKTLRKDYVEKVMQFSGDGKTIIFVDESNVNLFLRRSRGRAPKGSRAVVHMPTSKGPNIHMIGAMTQTGLVNFKRRRGSYRSDSCNEWLAEVLQQMVANGTPAEQIVLVMDNAPCHSKAESVFENFEGAQLLRLAPYSPMLNAIEGVWSVVKSDLKQKEAERLQELLAGDPANLLSKTEWRLQFVESLIDESIQKITPRMCMQFVNHTQSFFSKALLFENMPVGQ